MKARTALQRTCLEGLPPGYFTELVSLHNWPPRFAPQLQRTRELEQSEISRINRERRVAMGDMGTIVGLSDKSEAARLLRQISQARRRP